MCQLQLIVKYEQRILFLDLKKLGTNKKIKDVFSKIHCNQGGLVKCDDYRNISNGIPLFHNWGMLQMYEFSGQ